MKTESTKPSRPWLISVQHTGELIAPSLGLKYFPGDIAALDSARAIKLQRDIKQVLDSSNHQNDCELVNTMLRDILGYPISDWPKRVMPAPDEPETQSGLLVWRESSSKDLPLFVIFVIDEDSDRPDREATFRRKLPNITKWLCRTTRRLAICTNGLQWTLIYTSKTRDASYEWNIKEWFLNYQETEHLNSVRKLLSLSALIGNIDKYPSTLCAAISETDEFLNSDWANLIKRCCTPLTAKTARVELVKRQYDRIFRQAKKYRKNDTDAWELTNEVWKKILPALEKHKDDMHGGEKGFEMWSNKIVFNEAHRRPPGKPLTIKIPDNPGERESGQNGSVASEGAVGGEHRTSQLLRIDSDSRKSHDEPTGNDDDPLAQVIQKQLITISDEVLKEIREFDCYLLMSRINGVSYEEISEQWGITLQALKSRMHRAREDFMAAWLLLTKEDRLVEISIVIKTIATKYQFLLDLRYWQNLSHQEIISRIKKSPELINSSQSIEDHLYSARIAFYKALRDRGELVLTIGTSESLSRRYAGR